MDTLRTDLKTVFTTVALYIGALATGALLAAGVLLF